MDSRVKYGILIVVGGVGVYLIYKGGYLAQWFPSVFGPGGALATTPATTPSIPVPGIPRVPVLPPPPSASGTNFPAAGTTSISNGAVYQADGKGGWTLIKAAPSTACPPGQSATSSGACIPTPGPSQTFCDLNTPGWSIQNGQCLATPPAVKQTPDVTQAVSQQMIALAGTSAGLSLDQWCYYFTEATGQDCPFDPGAITPQEYNDAGVSLEDGTIGDRTTPTTIGTWLAFAQLKAPQLGLTGIEGLAALHVANAWLV